MTRVVHCEDCEHLHMSAKSDPPMYWLCTKFPKTEGFGTVSYSHWDNGKPYKYCREVKVDNCPLYEARKGPQIELEVA